IEHLLTAQAGDSVYDGGDWYHYPAPFPGGPGSTKDLFTVLAEAADDPADRSYANYVLQNYAGEDSHAFTDLLFRDPQPPAAFWSALPLQHFASGTGLLTARSSWDPSANVVDLQIGNPLEADHESLAPGQLEIRRGNDELLIHPNALLGPIDDDKISSFSNVLVVDSHGDTDANGDPVQTYPFNMGGWYGTPGVTVNAVEAA